MPNVVTTLKSFVSAAVPKLNPDTDGQSTVIPVRMDDELLEALREKARQGGISRSEAIREAVRAWTHVA